jgi:hypothetical protein
VTLATGAPRAFGATQFEVADILSKCAGEFKIGGKPQIQGPIWTFPQYGGASGSISTTGNAQTASIAQNGAFPLGREYRTPQMLGRYDSLLFFGARSAMAPRWRSPRPRVKVSRRCCGA